jgi:hypothetical protein
MIQPWIKSILKKESYNKQVRLSRLALLFIQQVLTPLSIAINYDSIFIGLLIGVPINIIVFGIFLLATKNRIF